MDKYNTHDFLHHRSKGLLEEGYVIIDNVEEDNVYDYDKWIVRSPKNHKRKTNSTYIDFSVIKNEELRYEFKKYLANQGCCFLKTVDEKSFRYILKAASAINSDIREFFLKDFLISELHKNSGITTYIYHFVEFFEESLGVDDIVCDWNILSVETVLNQNKYFIEKIKEMGCLKNNIKTYITSNITKYYKFLVKDKELQIFSAKDGITIEFLEKSNFLSMLEDGYRVVFANQFDEIPENDKWLLDSSSSTNRSTAISHNTLISLDFTSINNIKYRYEAKKWIRTVMSQLKSLKTYLGNISQFLNLLESGELDSLEGNVFMLHESEGDYGDITVNQIILYCQFLKTQNYSEHTIESKKFNVKRFIDMLREENYKISNNVYDYLSTKKFKKKKLETNRTVIDQDDLKKIYDALKEKARNDDSYKLMWGFIYLLNSTKLRNSEILSLTRNCLIPGMKLEDRLVKYLRKTSAGYKMVEEPLSKNSVRIIEKMMTLTDTLSKQVYDKELSQCIFLFEDGGTIKRIENDLFYRRFKRLLKSIGMEESTYTLYDFRHTYMTTLFESSISKGETWKAILATGHLDRKTTLKNYVKPHIKNYLEAMYKVAIGDISVKGEVVENLSDAMDNIPDNLNEIEVKRKCGYCKGDCGENNIDCLLCVDFVVTIDRLPYFIESLKQIDDLVYNESIQHEKEHLITIKRLYVAYIAKIKSLEEELRDIEEK